MSCEDTYCDRFYFQESDNERFHPQFLIIVFKIESSLFSYV